MASKDKKRDTTLDDEVQKRIHNERLRRTNNIEGESPFKNVDNIGKVEKATNLNDRAQQIIDSGEYKQNLAEREYTSKLSTTDRLAYERVKNSNGAYKSPYLQEGIEGKEYLEYNDAGWNALPVEERAKWLDIAYNQKDGVYAKTDKWKHEYATAILRDQYDQQYAAKNQKNVADRLKDIALNTIVGRQIKNAVSEGEPLGEGIKTFDADNERQWEFYSLPSDVREYLTYGRLLGGKDDTKVKEFLAENYDDYNLERLKNFGENVKNIEQRQFENEQSENWLNRNAFNATVGSTVRRLVGDIVAKPIAGIQTKANYILNGDTNTNQTKMQKFSNASDYIGSSIQNTLQESGYDTASKIYEQSYSMLENASRMYLAGMGGKAIGSLASVLGVGEKASNVIGAVAGRTLINRITSNAVFNDMFTQSIEQGMAPGEAFTRSLAYAFFEGAFETISFDKLGYFDGKPVVGSFSQFMKNLAKAGFVEGMEEYNTEIAQGLYDYYMAYDYSDYKAFKDKLEEQYGRELTDKEAWSEYGLEFANKASKAFLGGALSGMVLGATEGGRAWQLGREYASIGSQMTDEEYNRLAPVVDDWAKMFPRVAEEYQMATESGENVKRGYVKTLTDAMTERYNDRIDNAKTRKELDSIMDGMNSSLNGIIPEDTINKYNAKLAELGESNLVDYQNFQKNVQEGKRSTFSDMAYGTGDSAVLRKLAEEDNNTASILTNANMDNTERAKALAQSYENTKNLKQTAADIVSNLASQGKEFDSPEVRKYIGGNALSLEEAAKAYSLAKTAREMAASPVELKTATTKPMSEERVYEVFGDKAKGNIIPAGYEYTQNFREAYAAGQLINRLGVNVELFASKRRIVQNGAYWHNGTIFIDVNAGKSGEAAIGEVISHELTHFMADRNPIEFGKFTDLVRKEMGENAKGESVFDNLVKAKMELKRKDENGNEVPVYSKEAAVEEVMAEACQRMLKDSKLFQKYAAEDPKGAKAILSKLVELVRKLKKWFSGSLNSDATRVLEKNVADLEKIVDAWDAVLEGAIQANKYVSENDAVEVRAALEDKGNIVDLVERNDDGQMVLAKMDDGTLMYSERTWENGGKLAIVNALEEQGYSEEEIARVTDYIDKHLEYIKQVGLEYATRSFDKLAKNLDADITTDLATEADLIKKMEEGGISQEVINNLRSQNQIAYAYVSNGDYPMNIDLQLSCKKRIAYEAIINRMIETGLMADVRMSGEFIGEINTILAAHEFETQCLGCFVESRRLQMQKWAETFVSEWNQQVEKVTGKKRANATKKDYLFHGENAAGTDDAFAAHLQLEEAINSGERNRAGNGGIVLKERSVFNKMGELIAFNKKFYGKFLTIEDILTADGLKKLRALDNGNLFSLVKSRYGVASPKILQSFNPYNSEVLNLTFKSVSDMTGNSVSGAQNYVREAKKKFSQEDINEINDIINKNYDGKNLSKKDFEELQKEMINKRIETNAIRQYLLDIGGNRIQSFSDFMIENVFDMLQIFADMSIRDYAMHGYTKEQICLRLFGMTGAKWNGSWIAHNESSMGKEASGLMPYTEENAKHGITVEVDGEKYVIQFDDYERHVREKSFIQSIGFKDAIAIMLDPRYADNVGTITIGFSDKHIRAMLNSPYFRMVIPYHASGMIPGFAELVGANTYNDYTPYQTTGLNEILIYENGVAKSIKAKEVKEKEEEGVTKSSKGYKFSYKGNTYTVKPDMSFRFNEALQRTGDARAAAQEYVDWCRSEHPLNIDGIEAYATFSPAFSNSPTGYDFTQEYNYYKLLEDFNVYNSREEIINGTKVNARQSGVKLLYPGDEGGTLSSEQLKQYEADLKQTGLFSDKEIEKYVKKAQMTFDELVRGEVENRNAYYEGVFGKNNEKFDSAYEEIKQVSEKYKRNEQIADSKEQYLKSQEKAQKAKQNGNEKLLKAPAGTYLANIKYSLRDAEPVEPSNDKWTQTHDTEEAMRIASEHGVKMWDVSADYSGVANATQMAASYTSDKMLGTTNTYKKVYDYLGKGYDGRILDASSGMGYGTRLGRDNYGLDVTDIEPYPHETKYQFLSDKDAYTESGKDVKVTNPRHPDYMDYEELDRLVKSGEVKPFDFIISNAVLNVLPQDLRDSLVQHMGDLLAENGQMFINVRKVDEIRKLANNPKNVKLGDHEAVESNNGNYQYGFSEPELIAYIQDALGDKFTVVDGRKAFNTSSPTVLVTKKKQDVKYSTREDIIQLNIDWDSNESSTIREQLKANRHKLENMSPIAEIVYRGEKDKSLVDLVEEQISKIGGHSINRRFDEGDISFEFDARHVRDMLAYYRGDETGAAIFASPFVAKKGIIISGHKNHKNRRTHREENLTTVTIAAPVIINGDIAYVGVAIQFARNGKPKSADVDVDFLEGRKIKKAPRGHSGAQAKSEATYPLTGRANNSVAQSENGVKFAERGPDREVQVISDAYMEAIEKGDDFMARKYLEYVAEKKGYTSVVRYHQTGERFNEFKTDRPVAGANDSETPNGIFFKTNDHDIGVGGDYVATGRGGDIQMPVYLKTTNLLTFKNRSEASEWYKNNVPGYKEISDEWDAIYQNKYEPRFNALEEEQFDANTTDERQEELSRQEDALIEELKAEEDSYRAQMREALNDYFLQGKSGYDGIELVDDGHRYISGKREDVHTFIVFDPSQVKSAELITRDDDGNIIPPTERFNEDTNDIRYSERDSEGNSLSAEQEEYFKDSKVRDANGNLKVMFQGTQNGGFTVFDRENATDGFFFTDSDVIAESYSDTSGRFTPSADLTLDEINQRLRGLYGLYVKETKKGYEFEDEIFKTFNDLRDYIQEEYSEIFEEGLATNYAVYLNITNPLIVDANGSAWDEIQYNGKTYTTNEMAEIASEGGYDGLIINNIVDEGINEGMSDIEVPSTVAVAFNSNQIKSINNTNPTSNEDIRYSLRDLANDESQIIIDALKNGEALADGTTTQSIQAYAREYNKLKEMEEQLSEMAKSLKKKGTTPSERETVLRKMVRLDRAIINKTTELTEMRNQRVLRDILVHEWERRDELIDAGIAEAVNFTQQVLEEKYGDEIKSIREKAKAQKQAIRDRHEIEKHKKNIIKTATNLMNMIIHPNEKKKVPTILINPVRDVLEAIDYWSPKEGKAPTKKGERLFNRWYNFQNALKEMQDKVDAGAELIEDMFDPDFLEYVDKLSTYLSESGVQNVNDMGAEQIKILDQLLTELYHTINIGNKMISSSRYETVQEHVDKATNTLSTRKDLKEYKSNRTGSIWKRFLAGSLDAYGLARLAGDGTADIINMMSDAYLRKIDLMRQAYDFTNEVLDPHREDLEKWQKDEQTFQLDSGKTITMNVRTMIDLYNLSKREQAMKHIVQDTESERMEKVAETGEKIRNGGGIHVKDRNGKFTEIKKLTQHDLDTILNYLRTVKGAMEVGDKLQEFGATVVTDWGNRASNLLYGINKFTETNYWPIRSSESAMKEENSQENKMLFDPNRLKNMGRAKNINPAANNAIYVEDFLDVWSQTIDDMTSYAEMLPAVTDAMRWWNSRVEQGTNKRVKELFEQKLGTDLANNFRDLITALNGGVKGQDSLSKLAKSLMGKSKAAAVAFNPRVVAQQPTAYPRALARIEAKYLTKALTMKPAMKEAQEHSAIAWLKHQGFYSSGLAPSVKKLITGDATMAEKITEKTMYLAGLADDITWGALWNAAKLKVEDTTDLKPGTEEYWKAIDSIFTDIVNNTQVVDTPFTKSPWMRSNGLAAMYTAFMAEPLKTVGMLSTALDQAIRDPKKGAKALGIATAAWAIQSFANAAAQSIADAGRDDDKEKDYWEKYIEKFKDNTKDNLNLLTYIPVIKDVWSNFQGYQSTKNLSMQGVDNLVSAIKEINKMANGESKYTLFGSAELISKAASYLTGVPVSNGMRMLNSVGNVMGVDLFRRKDYTKSELGRNVILEVRDGNNEQADKYYNELLKRCDGEEDKANEQIYTYLSKHDEDVDRMAVTFAEDATTLDTLIDELVLKYSSKYVDDDIANKAIRKAAQDDQKEAGMKKTTVSTKSVGGTIYNSSDINRALEAGDIEEAQEIINTVNEGYKSKDSKSTAKTLVSDYWKPKYQAASSSERDQIMKMLYRLKNNGKQMFTADDFRAWAK